MASIVAHTIAPLPIPIVIAILITLIALVTTVAQLLHGLRITSTHPLPSLPLLPLKQRHIRVAPTVHQVRTTHAAPR
jgi:hypothetical protein